MRFLNLLMHFKPAFIEECRIYIARSEDKGEIKMNLLLARNGRIVWVADGHAKEQLLAIGVQPQAIFGDIQSGVEQVNNQV